MRIAIITFSDMNTNFGSILQSYALSEYLKKCGHEVSFIRYREFSPSPSVGFSQKVKQIIKKGVRFFLSQILERRKENFRCFIEDNLNHTRLYTSEEDLEQNLETYDVYICGSDQIWNFPVLGGLRKPYLLAFAPDDKIKIAYAPSIGEYKLDDELFDEIKKLASRLNGLSCREINGANLLSSKLQKTVKHVVDPVFLLSAQEWKDNMDTHINLPPRYGLCYFVRRNPLGNKMVKELKKKHKIPILNVSDNLILINGTNNSYMSISPSQFVRLVEGAEFCVGTSFHLAAFSTIFEKPCFIASSAHNQDRLRSLFGLVDYNHHLLSNDEDMKRMIGKADLSAISHTEELLQLIQESKDYLNTNISISNNE